MIRIGSARTDEKYEDHSGAAGDQRQTGTPDYEGECSMQDWYLHPKGWVVIRPRNRAAAEKIAQDMIYICDNPHIGYDQWQDQTLFNAAKPLGFNCSLVTTDCETDCAKAVRVCCWFAGIEVADFWTGTEISVLEKTGAFDIIRDPDICNSWERLCKGDILCTKTSGHTVVVLDDGPLAYADVDDGAYAYRATANVWLRTGPGTEYAKQVVVPDEKIMAGTGKIVNNWAEGSYKGYTGYASMKYLEPVRKEELVATGTARLRKGPGVIYATLDYIAKGEKMVATYNTQNVLGTIWHEVVYKGQLGWVSGKLVKEV